jgi:hypothetical protein
MAISRRMRWIRNVVRMEAKRIACRVEKPEGKRPLGRPTRTWEDNIKVYLREIEWDGMDWNHLLNTGAGCGF